MKFAVTIDRDEDGVWVVECPSIPGCVSQGPTKGEALDNIREAIALCLEVRAEVPEPVFRRRGKAGGRLAPDEIEGRRRPRGRGDEGMRAPR